MDKFAYLIDGKTDAVDESHLHARQLMLLVSVHDVDWFDVKSLFLEVALLEEFVVDHFRHLLIEKKYKMNYI